VLPEFDSLYVAEHPAKDEDKGYSVDDPPCAERRDDAEFENSVSEVVEHDQRGNGEHERGRNVAEGLPSSSGDEEEQAGEHEERQDAAGDEEDFYLIKLRKRGKRGWLGDEKQPFHEGMEVGGEEGEVEKKS